MKHYKGIMYFEGTNGRWYANHHKAKNNGYATEAELKRFIDKA